MKKTASADIVIFGGGIAGLWLLYRLRQSGLSAILFESGSLGGGQTHKSQGIIHGGMKYALQGVLTSEASNMVDVPVLWRACLDGTGDVDLTHVHVLSQHQHLWSPNKFAAKITGMMASATLSSKVSRVEKENYPSVFQHTSFRGDVYALDEMVLDVPSLVRELVKANQDAVFKIEPLCDEELKFDDHGNLLSATVYLAGKPIEVTAQQFIFTAGAGNEVIIKKLKNKEVAMQRRPLHMVMAKVPFKHNVYAHCLGLGARPRITITTHHMQDGSTIWYMGGQLAEDGIEKNSDDQIRATQSELHALFPWLDFTGTEYFSFMIDRAEPLQPNGFKPESTFTKVVGNVTVAWPTKLALAPKLAAEILQQIETSQLTPQLFDVRELRAWPIPPISKPIWESAFCKVVA